MPKIITTGYKSNLMLDMFQLRSLFPFESMT